jgi:hypothetical protein
MSSISCSPRSHSGNPISRMRRRGLHRIGAARRGLKNTASEDAHGKKVSSDFKNRRGLRVSSYKKRPVQRPSILPELLVRVGPPLPARRGTFVGHFIGTTHYWLLTY